MDNKYLSITQLTKYIRLKFDRDPYLEKVFLKGEISNSRRNRKGSHLYFSLKDDSAKISAVMFANSASKLKFEIEEGMNVLVTGRIGVYEKTGNYQIVVESMEPDGLGALYQAMQQTKEKLAKEGLFESGRKKPLVKYPEKIAVITSQSGAVIRDILVTLNRRYPIVQVDLYPSYVQGERAVDSLTANIKRADKTGEYDTIILGRGGGSIEDLWSFNEEKVVRAVAEAKTPLITSVGHQTDTTLVDYASDISVPTPTAAAEVSVPVLQDELEKILQKQSTMVYFLRQKINTLSENHSKLINSYIFRQPKRLYESYSLSTDQLTDRLFMNFTYELEKKNRDTKYLIDNFNRQKPDQIIQNLDQNVTSQVESLMRAYQSTLDKSKQKVDSTIDGLNHLSPLNTLARGFSYTSKDGEVVKESSQLTPGDEIKVHFKNGSATATVDRIESEEQHD